MNTIKLPSDALKNPPTHIIQAAKLYLLSKAYTMTVRPIIQNIQQEVIDKFKYKVNPEMIDSYEKRGLIGEEFIKDIKHIYMTDDKSFGHYMTEVYKRRYKLFPDISFEYCPLLVAEGTERDAARVLVDELEPYTGLSADRLICSGLKNYNNYIDINMRYLTQFVKL